jgi:hypothetical protein
VGLDLDIVQTTISPSSRIVLDPIRPSPSHSSPQTTTLAWESFELILSEQRMRRAYLNTPPVSVPAKPGSKRYSGDRRNAL